MQRQLFESFYKHTIETIALEVLKANKEFEYKDNLNGVYEEYLNQRTALKYLIKGNPIAQGETNQIPGAPLLYGHKVAACITCAIIKVRIIVSDKVAESDDQMYLLDKSNRLNEQVALLCGLSCLLMYMMEDKTHLFSSEAGSEENIQLSFPKTKYPERSSYLDSLVRGLYYSNLISNINPLLLSHIYFMIDAYHRKCIEIKELLSSKPQHTAEPDQFI